jgi:hypothetical protein
VAEMYFSKIIQDRDAVGKELDVVVLYVCMYVCVCMYMCSICVYV